MRNRLIWIAPVVMLFAVLCAAPAKADNIQLSCTGCGSGTTSLLSNGNTVNFSFIDVANQTFTGNGFIAVLVPTGLGTPSLTGPGASLEESMAFTSGDLGTLLGESFSAYNLSQFQSASQQVGPIPAGYTVYEFALGNVTLGPSGAGITGLQVTAPDGSVIVGYLETANGTYQTPMSESITIPEPGTSALLLAGLISLLGLSLILPHRGIQAA